MTEPATQHADVIWKHVRSCLVLAYSAEEADRRKERAMALLSDERFKDYPVDGRQVWPYVERLVAALEVA